MPIFYDMQAGKKCNMKKESSTKEEFSTNTTTTFDEDVVKTLKK